MVPPPRVCFICNATSRETDFARNQRGKYAKCRICAQIRIDDSDDEHIYDAHIENGEFGELDPDID